jgi:two-component system, chemotaxis family, CheB/CheR fusion protein
MTRKSKETVEKRKAENKDGFLVVGIGASAGGVKALKELFRAMPAKTGMAFVVILHLSQEFESSLAEIIQRETGMKVEQVTETVKVEPDHVYVIPPAKHLEMVDGVIRLKEPEKIKGRRVPIDHFLRSLAEAYKRRAVCIILSGTGTDGTLGMKHIKGYDGFAIVQDPQDAEYEGMPLSAIETKIADIVMPIAEMPEKLLFVRDSTERFGLTDGRTEKVDKEIKNLDALRDVLSLLRVRTGHDFANYKRPTLIRRIARHLQIHETDDLAEYLEILREKPEEVLSLLKNLLINVTNFFRDKEAFEALEKKIIPTLFAGKSAEDQVRVWIAGCSSGEEAYSLAILLCEYASTVPDPPKIQIFASDVDDEAIAEAREGRFTEAVVADVSPQRLRQFFIKDEDTYRIRKVIREMILFAPHNLLRDPPFSRLDLISCRNVMIYLNRETQEKVLRVFHFALRENGYLFLGASESADSIPNSFSPIDKKHRIYESRPASRNWNAPPTLPLSGVWTPKLPALPSETRRNLQSFGELHHRLIEQYAPPSILINEEGDILHLSENAGHFLRFVGGEPTANLLKVIDPSLLSDIRAALFAARQKNEPVEAKNIKMRFDGVEKSVDLIVRPVMLPDAAALIIFDESDSQPPTEVTTHIIAAGDEAMEAVVRKLEDELKHTKDQLRNTIEQYETSVEELKASNEELQAMNEEMRSAAEELETGKEELQSVNEELTTVNIELKEKMDEIGQTNSDLQNLMRSTDIATIFVDRGLNIKRYTPPATEIFNLIPADVGRPIEHITHTLAPDDFHEDAEQALKSLQTHEREVYSKSGHVFLARFSPYRTVDDKIDGVVLSFVDITGRKKSEDALARDLRDTQILHDLSILIVVENDIQKLYDETLRAAVRLTKADAGTVQIYDRETKELVLLAAQGFDEKMTGYYRRIDARSNTSCGQALASGDRVFIDFTDEDIPDPDGSLRKHYEAGYLTAQSTPLVTRGGRLIGMVTTHWKEHFRPDKRTLRFLDLLARQAADLIEYRQSEKDLYFQSLLLDAVEQSVIATDLEGKVIYWNRFAEQLFGWTAEDVRGRPIVGLTTPEKTTEQSAEIMETVRAGKNWSGEFILHKRDGTQFPAYVSNAPIADAAGNPIGIVGVAFDITQRKQDEESLRRAGERLQNAVNIETVGVVFFDNENRLIDGNEAFSEMIGLSREELQSGRVDWDELTPQEWLERSQEAFTELQERGRITPYEREYLKKDGTRRWGLFAATRIGENENVKYVIDITERKRAEEAVRESEERFRNLADSAPALIWINDGEGCTYANRQYLDFVGADSLEDLAGYGWAKFVHPDDYEDYVEGFRKTEKRRGVFEAQFRFRRHDGEYRWMKSTGVPRLSEAGELFGYVGSTADIHRNVLAERSVRESEERLRLILESAEDYAIFTSDLEGRVTRWNPGAEKIFGYSESEMLGQPADAIFTPEDRKNGVPAKEMKTALKQGRATDERWHLRKDGKRIYVSGVVRVLKDGEPEGFVKIAADLTERRELDEKLTLYRNQLEERVRERTRELAASNKQLKIENRDRKKAEKERTAMLKRLVSTQEDERKRIARDMHDQFGQQLTALRLQLESLRALSAEDEKMSETIDKTQALAKQLDSDVSFFVWELRPTALDDLGLRDAVKNYVGNWSKQFRIETDLHIGKIGQQSVAGDVEVNLYRILQEALNNVYKHARATRVGVILRERDGHIELIVEDDGVGFDPKKRLTRRKGLGLFGMQERAMLSGGEVDIESAGGKGTTVFVKIPFEAGEQWAVSSER